jgi:YHS domain-containing protein
MENLKPDPVCGLHIEKSGHTTTYHGEIYYFCSEECQRKFNEDPERYLHKSSVAKGQANA